MRNSSLQQFIAISLLILSINAYVMDMYTVSGNSDCREGATKITALYPLNGNIREGGDGDLHICVTHGNLTAEKAGITDLDIYAFPGDSDVYPSCEGKMISDIDTGVQDFMKGNGGKTVYLCAHSDKSKSPIEQVEITRLDCSPGLTKISIPQKFGNISNGDFTQKADSKGDIYMCFKRGCKATEVTGQWMPHGLIIGNITEEWTHGTSKTYSESKTESWSNSVTMTAKAGFKFSDGNTAGVEVSTTLSHKMTNSYSSEWMTSDTYKFSINWAEKYENMFSWQFYIIPTDSCGHIETTMLNQFAITEGAWQQPCCLPGYSADKDKAHYQKCVSKESMIANGEKNNCEVVPKIEGEVKLSFVDLNKRRLLKPTMYEEFE